LFVSHHLGAIAELCDYVVVLYAGEVAEVGTVRDIFYESRHPYTRQLLECDPGLIQTATRYLPTIRGEVPNLTKIQPGCVFATRCPAAFPACLVESPEPLLIGPKHSAAWQLPAEV